jgi:hypothetical protein
MRVLNPTLYQSEWLGQEEGCEATVASCVFAN